MAISGNSRYLNIHQGVYQYTGPNGPVFYTNILANTGNGPFNTGTNLSATADNPSATTPGTPKVGSPGAPWSVSTTNSAVFSIDLFDPNNRYLNIHQGVYQYDGPNGVPVFYTNILPNTGNGPFNTGTNVSASPENPSATSPGTPKVGSPGGPWKVSHENSAVYSIDLWDKTHPFFNIHQGVYQYDGPNGPVFYTNILPNTPNTPFNTGTNVSATADNPSATTSGTPKLGSPSGIWKISTSNSAVYSIDLF
ncbi:hypothetical protein AB0F92_40120 [Kitasatospora aureofaciens]|uniref:hypothetical protein n=1 Tax=Kitasatospora aureofaciens TaxID=1894 RepID=UPI0033C09BD0